MNYDPAALQQVRERRLLIDRLDSWLFDTIRPFCGQRVLEIGCGHGNLIQHFLDRELVIGMDVSAESVATVSQRFSAAPNVMAVVGDASQLQIGQLRSLCIDTVVSLNVLEHIEDDNAVLRNAWSLLPEGGRIVVVVPAHMALYGSMDRSIGHYRRYNRAATAAQLRRAGFDVCVVRSLNALGALGWLVNGRILRRQVPPVAQLKAFNALMPAVQRLESHISLPFGLSILAVAERKAA